MKACRHCYSTNPDTADTCHACGKSLRRSSSASLAVLVVLVGAVAAGAFYWHNRAQPAPATPPAPEIAAAREEAPPSTAPVTKPVPVADASPVAAPPTVPALPAVRTVSPAAPEAASKAAESTAGEPASGPKPRPRLAPPRPDTAEIIRTDTDRMTVVGNGDETAARFQASLWRAVLKELNRIDNFWARAGNQHVELVVRVNLRNGSTELSRASENVSRELRRDVAVAVARCAGTVPCPEELAKRGSELICSFGYGRDDTAVLDGR